MRTKLIFGNWKMNKTVAEAKAFATEAVAFDKFAKENGVDIGVAPTFLSLAAVKEIAPELTVAAQNCHFAEKGAYTGEVAIPMLKELGIDWCIIGHSERRTYNGETNKTCNQKVHALIDADMTVIYCCGETLEEFEAGKTKEVINTQIREGLADCCKCCLKHVVVAYEPIWSIGTGKNASVEIAEDICSYIRSIIKDMAGAEAAENIRILYGGSVKPENARAYLGQPDVDGALVGGASLKVESFKQLIENIL